MPASSSWARCAAASLPRMPELVESIAAIQPRGRLTRIVAIDGRGGSGKSELADRLSRRLDASHVVHTDDFARPNVAGWEWERLRAQVLEPVLADRPGRYQRYDWVVDAPAEWHDVPVAGTLIVEGISSMLDELGAYWDFAVWVECPYELRLRRGVERDGEAMRPTWTDVWMPAEDAYVEAQRPDLRADVVVDGSRPYEL
jgi:uridine kinase